MSLAICRSPRRDSSCGINNRSLARMRTSGRSVLAMLGGGMASVLALGRAVWASTSRGIRERVDALMDTVSLTLEEMGTDSTARTGGADRDGHEPGVKSRADGVSGKG